MRRIAMVLCVMVLSTVSAASGQSPSPSTSLDPSAGAALDLPAPPPDFDPSSIRWIGQPDESSDQAWVGAIDGSGLLPLTTLSADALLAADGSVVGLVRRKGDPLQRDRLVREVPGGPSTTLVSDASGALALAEDGSAAYVARLGGDVNHAVDRGYWRVPLDGSRPRRVLPPSDLTRTIGVVSPSGRSVATSYPSDIGGRRPQARFSMGRPRIVPGMIPLGFDERERLIGLRDRIVRYGPWTRTLTPVLDEPDASGDVLPGGAWLLVTFPDAEILSPPALIDLGTGARIDLNLVDGRWRKSPFSTDRYAVLEGRPGGRLTYAIVDLEEQWVGYVPFQPSLGLIGGRAA